MYDMMKNKYLLLIYNKVIGHFGFKYNTSIWRVKSNLYCM